MTCRYQLERVQFIARPLDEVFAYFARPENLQQLTPEFLRFQFITPSPIGMYPGSIIDYRLRLWGLPVRWQTRIVAFDPPHSFIDEQIRGPYRLWRHVHEFAAVNGGTRMVDRVDYELPLGPLGRVAHALLVRRSLRTIFDYRRDAVNAVWPQPADEVARVG